MVWYRRNLLPGGTFFFTVTLADRSSSALVDHIDLLRQAFRKARLRHPFAIDAIVILPDHLHTIMTMPEGDADFPARWKAIKAGFSYLLGKAGMTMPRRRNGDYQVWQRRYWEHTVRDNSDFERCANYIHFNPVKHGLVTTPGAWPYSSFHRFVRAGVLPPDWGGDGRIDAEGFGERAT